MNKAPSKAAPIMAMIGAASQAGPLIGVGGAVLGMMSAFETLSSDGAGNQPKLSAAIGQVLKASTSGLLIGLAGIILLIIAISYGRYRATWVFWFLIIYGGLLTLVFPFGTPFGLYFLVFCLTKREEFVRPTQPQA